jgi:hypothetical protein
MSVDHSKLRQMLRFGPISRMVIFLDRRFGKPFLVAKLDPIFSRSDDWDEADSAGHERNYR